MTPASRPCDQCGTVAPLTSYPPYGHLCMQCAFRQSEHDEAREQVAGLAPSSLGFWSDEE